jgi:SHS2 domain-containing protein
MKQKEYILLDHMADIKFKITGSSLAEIFENSAKAFSSYISSNSEIKLKVKKRISLTADNIETLMYKFIDELIFLLDADNFAVSIAEVNLSKDQTKINAVLIGDLSANYHLNHVKAATYAEMYIKNLGKNW